VFAGIVEDALRRVDVESRDATRLWQLLAEIRLHAWEPILLLDEPTEGLDVDTAHALLHDMVDALGNRSLLMITHDELPEGIVHRSHRLRDGRLEG
jgi:ATP-binding cassette subfamily C protein CydC